MKPTNPFDDPEKVDAFLKMMFTTCALHDWTRDMDGPELVFWMTKCGLGDAIKCGSLQEAVWEELEARLNPEYDGEAVTMTETGYMTPSGPVDYIGPDGQALRKAPSRAGWPAFDPTEKA